MSLYAIVAALQDMRGEMKALGEEAVATTVKVREAKAEATTGAMSANQGGSATGVSLGSTSATSLGDPRNAADSAMRMNAAIEAAKRR